MTVPSTRFREDYAGNGSATSFPYAFRIFKNTDLVVTKTDNSGNDTTLTLGTDYTVTGAGSYNGGAVVLTTALPTSYRLTIERVLAIRQDTDLRNQGEFLAETHEDAFDRLTMIVQRLAGYLGMGQDGTLRTLLLGTGDVDGAGAFRARGNRISDLSYPINSGDAAPSQWVLEKIASATLVGDQSSMLRTFCLTIDTIEGATSTAWPDGIIIFAKGLSAIADGLGGLLRYSATSTVAADGVRTFAPTGGGRLIRDDVRVATPQMFGSDPMFKPGADNISGIIKAIQYLHSSGGGVVFCHRGIYQGEDPIVLPAGVSLIAEDRDSTIIRKITGKTTDVEISAGPLVVYKNGSTLPTSMNAAIVLTGPGGRYTGRITDITLEGVYATTGDYESQSVEFGLVSVGSVSDFTLERTYINHTKYGAIFPTIFASSIQNNRITGCLQAVGIDDGTSLTYKSNYANNCRDSHFIRGLKYSTIRNNAADFTNDPEKFPDRTKVRFAYRIRSLVGCDFSFNGDEQTWGRSIWMETLDACDVKHNLTIGVGSDYIGAEHIAVLYSDGVLRGCDVSGNLGYDVKEGGLIYGGADASKHHNHYFETTSFVIDSTIKGNMVRTSLAGSPVEAGWGNSNPSNWINSTTNADIVKTFNPTLAANSMGDLVITYGSDNKHYLHDVGKLYHIFGCFDITATYTTAGSYLIFQGFPANQSIPWRIQVTGVDNDSALTKKLGSFVLNENQGTGIAFDEDGNTFLITDIPTGASLKIYYDGWYSRV